MATIKFKNGSSWETISFGATDEDHPVGSFYISPACIYLGNSSSYPTTIRYLTDITKVKSPSELFGGTWIELIPDKINLTGTFMGYVRTSSIEPSFLTYLLSGNGYSETTPLCLVKQSNTSFAFSTASISTNLNANPPGGFWANTNFTVVGANESTRFYHEAVRVWYRKS